PRELLAVRRDALAADLVALDDQLADPAGLAGPGGVFVALGGERPRCGRRIGARCAQREYQSHRGKDECSLHGSSLMTRTGAGREGCNELVSRPAAYRTSGAWTSHRSHRAGVRPRPRALAGECAMMRFP